MEKNTTEKTPNTTDKKEIHGLVLGGGGARGCFEIGAWQAFHQLGIHFDCVAGTSIGALVGAIYVQHTLDRLVEFVYEMSPDMIAKNMPEMPDSFEDFQKNRETYRTFLRNYLKDGGADISPLKAAIARMFNWKLFSESDVNFACMTYNVSKLEPAVFFKKNMTEEDAQDIILASASCYPAFPMLKMNGDYYIDGGYEDNLPVSLAQEMGATHILAIDVHGPGRTKPLPLDGTVRYMEPVLPLDNFLDFHREACIRSLRIGYLETLKQFDAAAGYLFTFKAEDWGRIYMIDRYLDMNLSHFGISATKEMGRSIAGLLLGAQPGIINSKYTADYASGLLVEDLALLAGLDPVKLYTYDTFVNELAAALANLPRPALPGSVHDSLSMLRSSSRKEILNFMHAVLSHYNGKFPLVFDPLKKIFDTEYTLACVWYCLTPYLPEAK